MLGIEEEIDAVTNFTREVFECTRFLLGVEDNDKPLVTDDGEDKSQVTDSLEYKPLGTTELLTNLSLNSISFLSRFGQGHDLGFSRENSCKESVENLMKDETSETRHESCKTQLLDSVENQTSINSEIPPSETKGQQSVEICGNQENNEGEIIPSQKNSTEMYSSQPVKGNYQVSPGNALWNNLKDNVDDASDAKDARATQGNSPSLGMNALKQEMLFLPAARDIWSSLTNFTGVDNVQKNLPTKTKTFDLPPQSGSNVHFKRKWPTVLKKRQALIYSSPVESCLGKVFGVDKNVMVEEKNETSGLFAKSQIWFGLPQTKVNPGVCTDEERLIYSKPASSRSSYEELSVCNSLFNPTRYGVIPMPSQISLGQYSLAPYEKSNFDEEPMDVNNNTNLFVFVIQNVPTFSLL